MVNSRGEPTGEFRKQHYLHGKCPVHAREGVRSLRFVDPTDRTLEAFELHEGRWVLIASAKDDDPVGIRPFDAVACSLGDLWP